MDRRAGHIPMKNLSLQVVLQVALLLALLLALSVIAPKATAAETIRVKDLGKMQGWRENALIGYGIVTGLAGTGDSSANRATRQTLSNVLSQFNLTIPAEQIQSRNVAVVMVTASLPAFAREGDTLDITVTSSGDARSLLGGSLLLTPLKGPNGKIHALAQGPLSIGGYRYGANGNLQQKNHPTVGSVPGGAVVELAVASEVFDEQRHLRFLLAEPDYTTASRIATAINRQFGSELAEARDAGGIDIRAPAGNGAQLVNFLTRIENVQVEPDRRARVVINERTGTVVSGGDVRIARVVISHGDLKISVSSQTIASQPQFVSRTGAGVRTALVTNSDVDVEEQGAAYVAPEHTTVADLVQALARMKTNTRDMISIIRAIKAAGALHAELVIQ